MKTASQTPDAAFQQIALRVSRVSIVGNTVLSLVKLIVGVAAHSGAMVSDAVHSASDVLSSLIVIIGVKTAGKASDRNHPYGHDRFESVAAIVLAVLLAVTGLFIGHVAIEKLTSSSADAIAVPGRLALAAAIVSILCKEAMYHYTRHYAKIIHSGALMADAWHHRSDAFSSIGSLVGILGARLGHLWLEPVASLVICGFILKVSYDIFLGAINQLVDRACAPETEQEIANFVASQPQVLGISRMRTREFGNKIYVDLDVFADPNIPLAQAHALSLQVHQTIEEHFPCIKHIAVRVVPKA